VIRQVTDKVAPAMGDVRRMQTGDVLILHDSARKRADWSRYQDAVRHATMRGAEIRWAH
jgi:hypothetical protein